MKTSLRKSQTQEKKAASRYGGHVNPGSGNQWYHKGDVRTPDLLIEAKYTDAASYSLKVADLHKVEKQAYAIDKDWAFLISFGGEEFVVIRESDYLSMRGSTPS